MVIVPVSLCLQSRGQRTWRQVDEEHRLNDYKICWWVKDILMCFVKLSPLFVPTSEYQCCWVKSWQCWWFFKILTKLRWICWPFDHICEFMRCTWMHHESNVICTWRESILDPHPQWTHTLKDQSLDFMNEYWIILNQIFKPSPKLVT